MQAERRYQLGGGPPAMRALSIRQPWLHAIFHLGKTVENRDWSGCDYRGPVLLHASKGCGKAEFASAGRLREDIGVIGTSVPALDDLPRGCIVGIARLVGATRHSTSGVERCEGVDGRVRDLDWGRGFLGYRMAGALGLELVDVRELPPVPYKGALGFFAVNLEEQGPGYGTPHKALYEAAWRELAAASRRVLLG
jgi:hypothetical protein